MALLVMLSGFSSAQLCKQCHAHTFLCSTLQHFFAAESATRSLGWLAFGTGPDFLFVFRRTPFNLCEILPKQERPRRDGKNYSATCALRPLTICVAHFYGQHLPLPTPLDTYLASSERAPPHEK